MCSMCSMPHLQFLSSHQSLVMHLPSICAIIFSVQNLKQPSSKVVLSCGLITVGVQQPGTGRQVT
jgi:hypothetical protein